jgi:hypothetical protein
MKLTRREKRFIRNLAWNVRWEQSIARYLLNSKNWFLQ